MLLLAALIWMGATAQGQYIHYGDSNYIFHKLDTFPPFISGFCLHSWGTGSWYAASEGGIVEQWGSMYHADSLERIYGIAVVADTMNYSMYELPRRDRAVSMMLYLYQVPRGTTDYTLLDSAVFDVTMPYWNKMVYSGVDTTCPNRLMEDTLPVYELLFSREHLIPGGDSVLVTRLELLSPKDHPHYRGECLSVYVEQIWDTPPEAYLRHIHNNTLYCDCGGHLGPMFPIRQRSCPKMGGVRVDTVDGTTVCLSWPPYGDASAYRVEYGPEGFQYGGGAYSEGDVVDGITDTTYCVGGLDENRVYTFYVSAYCDKVQQYGMPDSIKALTNDNVTCEPPRDFRLRHLTATGASLSWDTVGDQRRFELLVRRADGTLERRFEPDSNPYELTLVPGVTYSVWLRAQCRHQCAVHDTMVWGAWKGPLKIHLHGEGVESVCDNGVRFAVVPNPAHGTVTVETKGVASTGGTVTVTDVAGRTLLREALVSDSQQLGISNLPAGTYFVTLTTKEGSSTRKLVVE